MASSAASSAAAAAAAAAASAAASESPASKRARVGGAGADVADADADVPRTALLDRLKEAVRTGDVARARAVLNTDPTLVNTPWAAHNEGVNATMLSLASMFGDVYMMQLALERGANMEHRVAWAPEYINDANTSTCLENAMMYGSVNAVELLLRHGAAIRERWRRSVGHACSQAQRNRIFAAVERAERERDTRATVTALMSIDAMVLVPVDVLRIVADYSCRSA